MKLAIIGGGSTYSPELVHGIAERSLGVDTIALMDTSSERLGIVGGFVRRMAPSLRIETTTDADAALEGADFVVTQIRAGGQAARLEDERLGLRHGVIGQETTGVGGLAKALRTIPVLLDYAARIERRAPHATLINFTNPVSIVTEALLNHGRRRTIGLCNIPISQRMEIAAKLGVAPAEVVIDSVGLNHLSFIRSVQVRGEEVLPELLEHGTDEFPAAVLKNLGMIPSDYLQYFFTAREAIEAQRKQAKLRAEEVMIVERELLEYYADPKSSARPESLTKRGGAFYSHAALEIIEAVARDTKARLIVDTLNGGSVGELPAGACVELPCEVGRDGPRPLPQRPLEPVIRGLIQHVKAYEELAIRAALSKSRRDLFLALLAHPLMPSAHVAGAIADELGVRLGW
jgi:6-phospho-beta-glucosidase